MTETRRGAGRITAAYVVLLVALLASGWLLTHSWERAVDPRDDAVVRWLAERRTADLDLLFAAGSHLADIWVGVVLAVALGVAVARWQRSWVPAVYFAVLMAGHLSLYFVVTAMVPRDRPPVRILDPGLVPDHSFPSAHAGIAVVVYGGAAILLARVAPGLRRWVWPLFLVPVVVSAARLYQGAHHPTDVLAGLLYAAAWLGAVAHVLLGPLARTDRTDRAARRPPVSSG